MLLLDLSVHGLTSWCCQICDDPYLDNNKIIKKIFSYQFLPSLRNIVV